MNRKGITDCGVMPRRMIYHMWLCLLYAFSQNPPLSPSVSLSYLSHSAPLFPPTLLHPNMTEVHIIPSLLTMLVIIKLPSCHPLYHILPLHFKSSSHLISHCHLVLGICYNALHLHRLQIVLPTCLFVPPNGLPTHKLLDLMHLLHQ